MAGEAGSKSGFHYAFLIVAAGVAITCVPCACVLSCAGIFFTPVANYFAVPKAQVSLYFSILNLAMMVMLPIAGKLMERFDLRIVLSACVLVDGFTYLAMSQFGAVWMFYVAGALLGLGTAPLIYLAIPTLINNWCKQKVGFFIGLCMAFTGIGGVIFNPLGTAFINAGPDGWRMGYLVLGAIILVATLPFTLFVVRTRPSDKGLLRYGESPDALGAVGSGSAEDGASEGVTRESASQAVTGVPATRAMKSAAFAALAVYAFLITGNQQVYQFFASYCQSFTGTEIALAAGAVAGACMAGQALAKVVLGAINDKSARAGLAVGISCGIAGIALMWVAPLQIVLLMIGSFLFGFAYACNAVEIPMLTRAAFGELDYLDIYSKLAMASAFGGVVATTLWGFIIDMPGGYSLMFGISIAVMALCAVLGFAGMSRGQKMEHVSR